MSASMAATAELGTAVVVDVVLARMTPAAAAVLVLEDSLTGLLR